MKSLPFFLATLVAAALLVFPSDVVAQQSATGQPTGASSTEDEDSSPTTTAPTDRVPESGSLWSGQTLSVEYFTDLRAKRVGDILTIRVVENVRAQQAAGTDTSREADVSMGISELFGLQNYLPSDLGLDALLGGSSSRNFKGGGSNSRSNNLSATISATVVEVTASGQLVVEATRFMKVNQEEENLTLRGIVRATDVSPTNEVLSTKLANLEVRYGGQGVIGSNLKPGILMRIVQFLF